jgi:nucleoside-diphosphate-sugar epimerase
VAALGTHENPISEETKWKEAEAKSYYGYTKHLAERQVFRGIEEGLPAVIANPSVILGAGNWDSGSPNLFLKTWRGLRLSPGGANGFVTGTDVARACRLLADSDYSAGERFILNSENRTYLSLFQQIAKSLGKNPPKNSVNPGLAVAYGFLQELSAAITGKEPLVTRESARSATRDYAYTNKKFCEAFSYRFEPIDACIEQTAHQFLKEHGIQR